MKFSARMQPPEKERRAFTHIGGKRRRRGYFPDWPF
jgi:hypothetical protein